MLLSGKNGFVSDFRSSDRCFLCHAVSQCTSWCNRQPGQGSGGSIGLSEEPKTGRPREGVAVAIFLSRFEGTRRLARRSSQPPYLVFGNQNYRDVILNWISAAERVAVSNVIVVAYDRTLSKELKRQKIDTVHVPMPGGKENLWWRLFVFEAMCRAGIDFVHCDADAVLLRNPTPYLESFPAADLIISQETVHPQSVAESRGFVVCMGFFFLRGTSDSLEMISEALRTIPFTGTDQAALNSVLPLDPADWDWGLGNRISREHRGVIFCFLDEEVVLRKSGSPVVVLLPHPLFQRFFLGLDSNPFLVHPLASQNARSKISLLQSYGLWFL